MNARAAALAATLGACALLGACGDAPQQAGTIAAPVERAEASRLALITQVPRQAHDDWWDPAARLPRQGSRLLLVDVAHPEGPIARVAGNFETAAEAAVHHDGKRICFVGRKRAEDPFAIFTCTLDGSEPEQVAWPRGLCSSPAWLPDGRIVYAQEVEGPPPAPRRRTPWALFVAGAHGEPSARITFSGLADQDPAVLRDGRIIYSGIRPYPSLSEKDPAFLELFTVHPDGTGVQLFSEIRSALCCRPRQGPDGTVYTLHVSDRASRGRGDLTSVGVGRASWGSPLRGAFAFAGPGNVLSLDPTQDGGLLVVAERDDAEGTGLYLLGCDGRVRKGPLFEHAELDIVHVAALAPRPRPQGHLSTADVHKEVGTFLGIAARSRGGLGASHVRILAKDLEELDVDGNPTLRDLGTAPLAQDGSFYVRVPADVPLFVLLEASGRVLSASRTPIWVRGNEIRGCTGCHDGPDVTPPNVRPLAIASEPVSLRSEDDR